MDSAGLAGECWVVSLNSDNGNRCLGFSGTSGRTARFSWNSGRAMVVQQD